MFDISQYNNDDFNATYSPEDNKLRLYAAVRIDSDHWQEMKKNGWKWAPKQELFYAFWSVENEDFCLSLAGDILPEEMTMVERAEAKAKRLLILAEKRSEQCIGYQRAANDLRNRLENNQPILLGHHSQNKISKSEKQIERAIEKAKETGNAVGYWVWKAQGVVGHANYKNAPRTIYNRIKTLSKSLRDNQKVLNKAAHNLTMALKAQNIEDPVKQEVFTKMLAGYIFRYEYSKKVESGEISISEAINNMIAISNKTINSQRIGRVINHILNRLAYEQDQLAIIPLYEGEITPVILQTFLRTHGADKPKVTKTDYGFLAESAVCLPLHISNSEILELDENEWRHLMQSLGYEVPVKKTTLPPILNFKTKSKIFTPGLYGNPPKSFDLIEVNKESLKNMIPERKRVRKSSCGTFRFRTILKNNPNARGYWDTTEYAIFITDSKEHNMPDSLRMPELAEVI